jgi:hypothetical protein
MAKIQEPELIEIKKLNIKRAVVEIVGDSPLIVHAWSKKAKQEMLDKQMKKAKGPKVAKNPEQDYMDAFYRLPREKPGVLGKPGFPSIGFKAAAVSAAGRFADGMKMTEVRGCFHVEGELVEIIGEPNPREDMVRIGMGTADIRYRPEFKTWRCKIPIRYNADAISLDQIVNLFNMAGFGVGVGEWRPEKDGLYGMFHVANGEEPEKKEKK